jgi:hypothetical protein
MASNSEVTYGAKLNNAKDIVTHLRSFKDYAPPLEEQKPDNLEALTVTARAANVSVAGSKELYSNAVDKRQSFFEKDADSLIKIMSPIGRNISSAYGKNSKELADIMGYAIKIRGEKRKKEKKEPTEESVSQSAKSFGSRTENFSDMIAVLEKMTKYKPANKKLEIAELKVKLGILEQSNTAVTDAFGVLKQERDKRNDLYDQLNVLVQGIKDAVIGQYTINSSEYKLIKGLKV